MNAHTLTPHLDERRRAMMRTILERLAKARGLEPEEILARSRDPELVKARAALYGSLRLLGWSYEAIGRAVGRDHQTILFAVRRHPEEASP